LKYLKYAAIVLIVLAIVAAVVHSYRESIALDFANSALREQGVTATELSIETIGTDYIRLSYLVLEQDDGTRYEVSGLSFPVSFPSIQPETISIENLVLVPAPADDAPLPLARLLQTFLQLPVSVPNTEIKVSRFTMPDVPPIDAIVWRSEGQRQHLAFSIDQIDVTINVDAVDDGGHQLAVLAAIDGNADALSVELSIRRDDSGFTIDGTPEFDFSQWLPVLSSLGLIPADIVLVDVAIDGPVTLVIDDDATLPITASMHVSLEAGPLEYEAVTLGRAKLSATLKIAIAEATRVDVSPDLLMELTGIESPAFSVASISATQSSSMQLTFDKGEWSGDIDQLELAFDSLSDRESLLASAPILFAGIRLRNSAATIEALVSISPGAAALSWDDTGIVVPGVEGRVSLQNNQITASLQLADNDGALTASVDVLHDLATGAGSISVTDATLQFGRRKLSGHLLEWPHAWDVVSGSWITNIEMDWNTGNDPITYSGTMTHHARALAGNYDDYVFSDLNTELSGDMDSATGVTLSAASIEVGLLDVGLPLKQITADFDLNIDQQAVRVRNLSMSVLGGKLLADPFRFGLQEEQNDLVLRPQSIQLQFMAELAELESIELIGSLSGTLPITVHDKAITIVNGRLENDPPGGVIRYLPGVAAEAATDTDSGIGLVSRALANFQFDSLTSDVNYTENGDLMLQMKLTGVNPDMDANQPVILNLGVENNVPQLLRSLRATRSIEEILERMTGNQAR
jgi:hypothetical protein